MTPARLFNNLIHINNHRVAYVVGKMLIQRKYNDTALGW